MDRSTVILDFAHFGSLGDFPIDSLQSVQIHVQENKLTVVKITLRLGLQRKWKEQFQNESVKVIKCGKT